MHLSDRQKNLPKIQLFSAISSQKILQKGIKEFIGNIKACNELILLYHSRVFPYIHTYIVWILSFYYFPKK